MRVDKKSSFCKERFFSYVLGLIMCDKRKNCVQISKTLNKAHDWIYKFFCVENKIEKACCLMMDKIVCKMSKIRSGVLILDDSSICKLYARLIEGVYFLYNVSTRQETRGLTVIVIVWSNGLFTIPLRFQWLFNKKIVGIENYKSKSEIAKELVLKVKNKVPFDRILVDGHYTTIEFMNFLTLTGIKFVGKIARNKNIITQNGEKNQIKNHSKLKLSRNEKSKVISAEFRKTNLLFSVHKRKNRKGDFTLTYVVSNINAKGHPKIYLEMYKQRWAIEVMFRTIKQSLGLQDCSCRSIEKQSMHVWAVLAGYGFLQYIRYCNSFETPEKSILFLRAIGLKKSNLLFMSKFGSFENGYNHVPPPKTNFPMSSISPATHNFQRGA